MPWAGPRFKNPLAGKPVSDFMPVVPCIIQNKFYMLTLLKASKISIQKNVMGVIPE